jgi:tetratricopeptide (TPR) repeat protein
LHPEERKAYYDLAALQKSLGRTRPAEKTYLAAVRANPKHASPHLHLAAFYEASGRVEKAVEAYEQALEVEFLRDPALVHRRLGQALQRLGRDTEAKTHLRMGVKAGR